VEQAKFVRSLKNTEGVTGGADLLASVKFRAEVKEIYPTIQ